MTVFDQADLLIVDSGISSDTVNKMARARLQESDVDYMILSDEPFVGYGDDEPAASGELSLTGRIAGLYSVCNVKTVSGASIGSALT